MKKLFVIVLFAFTLSYLTCNKKSSDTKVSVSTETATKKCPNCSSDNTGDYHDTSGNGVDIPGLKVCHTCGITF